MEADTDNESDFTISIPLNDCQLAPFQSMGHCMLQPTSRTVDLSGCTGHSFSSGTVIS
jgi:hypothetical protein